MRILLLNQCFFPDHVATAQHLTDLGLGLVERGHEVTVVSSSRGYDNPAIRYATRELWRGMDIRRIWVPGLGKKSKWRRAADFGVFWLNAMRILFFLPRFDVTVCLTSPPLISFLGTLAVALKGGAVVPWVMDLNPDEAVAAGWLKAGGMAERILSALQRWGFQRSARIVALDRFMTARLEAKGISSALIHTDAPWSHDDAVRYDAEMRAAFRKEHGLEEKFVVMYSGNHSPCHPLDTVLAAAERLRDDGRVCFAFIGGGSEFAKVKRVASERGSPNIFTLPYQPMDKLSGSLSSADLHLVVMGDAFVGIVHPCKIYNVLALGLPFLAVGPEQSHLTDLAARLSDKRYTMCALPDDVEALVDAVQKAAERGALLPSPELRALASEFSLGTLRPRLIGVIENAGCDSI